MPLQLRIHPRLDEIDPDHWDALRPDDNPFLSHTFLAGLERHGCVRTEVGWQPWHLAWYRDNRLVAAAPTYLKGNSHGEFVFDWSWAQAYEATGKRYYPKLVSAVPYTPITGARLLTGAQPDAALGRALASALIAETQRLNLSGVHINFADTEASDWLQRDNRWLPRCDIQFHWRNQGYAHFDDFLAALTRKKRKNIRQERERLYRAGWRFQRLSGHELDARTWQFIHTLYVSTFAEKGNYPALSERFFEHLGEALPGQVMVVMARSPEGKPVAMALFLHSSQRLFGRYWGSLNDEPGLHFECCYYQGIEFAIERGLAVFEPGAQGEHKLARGFLPTLTRSYHHLCDSRLHERVGEALREERATVDEWQTELMNRSPFADVSD
jgi:predicted N-acyltransferase